MAFKNLVFLVAVAVFLQITVADILRIQRRRTGTTDGPEGNEVLKDDGRDVVETNNVNESSTDPAISELDLMMFTLPGSYDSQMIHVVQDFRHNKTVLIDPDNQRCFVSYIDYDRYSLPSSLLDFVREMNNKDVDLQVVRENIKAVVLQQPEDMERMGYFTQEECSKYQNYLLIRVEAEAM